MVTSILQDQQYMFGVKKFLLMVEKVLLMKKNLVPCCFDNDRSGRFPHTIKPACDGINVYINLDDMLKLKH